MPLSYWIICTAVAPEAVRTFLILKSPRIEHKIPLSAVSCTNVNLNYLIYLYPFFKCFNFILAWHKSGDRPPAQALVDQLATGQSTPPSIPGQAEYEQGKKLFMQTRYKQALPYFEQAAASAYPPAYLYLGALYNVMIGPEDSAKSKDWYQKAEKNGHSLAEGQLYLLNEKGPAVLQESQWALGWFQKIAAKEEFLTYQALQRLK